jgi:type 1 glutamine amidotransferase
MKKALMIHGGMWHDFDGFEKIIAPVLQAAGYAIDSTYDLNRLLRLEQEGYAAVISGTCFSIHRAGQEDRGPEGLDDSQVQALSGWVQKGGGLLAVHAATVTGKSNPEYKRLLGGEFIEHPPAFSFTVYPVYPGHPITQGVSCFTVFDEFYIEKLTTAVDIQLVAFDRGQAYPMAWSKREGSGRVAHVAMGHASSVWNLPDYQRLMTQSLNWVVS